MSSSILTRLARRFILACVVSVTGLVASSPVGAHQGHFSDAPWEACSARSLGDKCQFENAEHDVFRGSCQSISAALVCVRNKPIEKSSGAHRDAQERGAPPLAIRWIPFACLMALSVALLAVPAIRKGAARDGKTPAPEL